MVNSRRDNPLRSTAISSLNVSILIPVFNEEKVIEEKLNNCLECNSNTVLEILIIDDYSTDSTVDIVRDWINSHSYPFSTKLLTNFYEKGKAGALRTGIKHAQAEIILITDADNLLFHDTIYEALRLFKDANVWGVTSTQIDYQRSTDGKHIEELPISFYERLRNAIRMVASRMDSVIEFHGQCMFFRREKIPIPDPNIMCDDHDLAIRIRLKDGKGKYCPKSRYIEFVQPNSSLSYKLYFRRARAIVEVFLKHVSCLFNIRLGLFGMVIFPSSFICYLLFPLLTILALVATIMFLISCNIVFAITFVVLLTLSMIVPGIRRLSAMQFIMLHALINYFFHRSKKRSSWVTPRNYQS